MKKQARKQIPKGIQADVLFKANHRCCICREPNKDVTIHHIDGNSSNNVASNLIVLCWDCHSKVTGRRGLGKSFSKNEVIKYKLIWEKEVQDSRKIRQSRIYYKKELVSQVDMIICEILCTKKRAQIEKLLDMLYELHLWRGAKTVDNKILEGLKHLALMGGLSSGTIAELVADKAWEMCWHFVEPEDVPMSSEDQKYVLKCIGLLETLSIINADHTKSAEAAKSIVLSAENIFRIGLWYSCKAINNAVLRVYIEGIEACRKKGKIIFLYGHRCFISSLRRMKKELSQEKRYPKHIFKKIESILIELAPIS